MKKKRFFLLLGLAGLALLVVVAAVRLELPAPKLAGLGQTGQLRFKKIDSIAVRQDQGMGPTFVTLDPARNQAYVTVPKKSCQEPVQGPESLMAVLALNTHQLKQAISTPYHLLGLALSPDKQALYASNSYDDRISRIDPDTGQVVLTLPAGPNPTQDLSASCGGGFNYKPQFLAFSRDSKYLYATNSKGNFVSVIDTQKQELAGQIGAQADFASAPRQILWGIAANPVRDELYVGVKSGNKILIIDTTLNQVAGEIKVSEDFNPLGLAVGPRGNTLYAANAANFSISIFSLNTRSQINEIKLPQTHAPNWITLDEEGKYGYVTTVQENTVYVLDLGKEQIAGKFEGEGFPFMAVPLGDKVYTTSITGDSLHIYQRQ